MYEIRRDGDRSRRESDWLKSSQSFSFGDYYDESNRRFGSMVVFNEDIVDGGRGFGAHPHREMEIISIVLSGRLKHEDSSGGSAETTYGGVQRMTAGTGIVHSEVNPDPEEPVHFLQIWFTPDTRRLAPSYETSTFDPKSIHGQLLPIVSQDAAGPGAAGIHQDVNVYLCALAPGQGVVHYTREDRLLALFVLDGSLTVEGVEGVLDKGDMLRASGYSQLPVSAGPAGTRLLLIDMADPDKGGQPS